jgi:phage-related protein
MAGRFAEADQKLPPPEVRRSIGSALYDAQKGEKAPIAKPFKGVGSGVLEIALHAFQKKSRHGIATPKSDVDPIKQRYRQAVKMEEE